MGITYPDSSTNSFVYDPNGKRVKRTAGGETVNYLYDGWNVGAEIDETEAVKRTYFTGMTLDDVFGMSQEGSAYYYLKDGLGSVTGISDSTQQIVKEYAYNTYGNVTEQTGSVDNEITYTSRRADPDSDLYCYRTRYYAASVGRFISTDKHGYDVLNPMSIHRYLYVYNNPVNLVDPWGLWAGIDDLIAIGGGGIVGGAWGIGTEAVGSLFFGEEFSWGDVGMSALSGATFAEVSLYAGPIAGGAAAGFVHSMGNEIREKGSCVSQYDWGGVALETGLGAGLGWLGGKFSKRPNVRDNWFRFDSKGSWKVKPGGAWQRGRHFHFDPTGSGRLMNYHLPHQAKSWNYHLKGILRGK